MPALDHLLSEFREECADAVDNHFWGHARTHALSRNRMIGRTSAGES